MSKITLIKMGLIKMGYSFTDVITKGLWALLLSFCSVSLLAKCLNFFSLLGFSPNKSVNSSSASSVKNSEWESTKYAKTFHGRNYYFISISWRYSLSVSIYIFCHIFFIFFTFTLQIKIKMCRMCTVIHISFENIQYYFKEFNMVQKHKYANKVGITSWQLFGQNKIRIVLQKN